VVKYEFERYSTSEREHTANQHRQICLGNSFLISYLYKSSAMFVRELLPGDEQASTVSASYTDVQYTMCTLLSECFKVRDGLLKLPDCFSHSDINDIITYLSKS